MYPKYLRLGNRHLRCCMGERESIFFTFMRELQHVRMEQFPIVALLAKFKSGRKVHTETEWPSSLVENLGNFPLFGEFSTL